VTLTGDFRSLDQVRLPARPLHLAVGMFDGVHLGHRAVIGAAVEAAREDGGIAAALTFWPHPSVLFRPQTRPG
jgi:riboflavin kinase/FMN adenylyltransferase